MCLSLDVSISRDPCRLADGLFHMRSEFDSLPVMLSVELVYTVPPNGLAATANVTCSPYCTEAACVRWPAPIDTHSLIHNYARGLGTCAGRNAGLLESVLTSFTNCFPENLTSISSRRLAGLRA